MGESWSELGTWFERVADLPRDEALALLERECPDPALRREVRELLEAESRAGADLAPSAGWRRRLGGGLDFGRDESGRRVGRWRLERRLGSGGMGTVWLARREDDFEQRVALKLLRRGLDSEHARLRFAQERQVLAHLEHPGIARLIDGGADADGQPYMALEFVEGTPIDRWCDERRLDLRARLELFEAVCEAVQYAHRNLVVHRDLKPANILVGEDGRPRLLDFGIAKLLDDDAPGLTRDLAQAGAPLTPEYASPEQVRGDPVTTASDVYALGVVLFRLLTSTLPLDLTGATRSQIERTVCEREPPLASRATDDPRLARRLEGDLDTIVAKALRKEPERRYGSVEELAADLRRHLEGRPVRARPDTFLYRASRTLRRHALAFSLAAAVFAGLTLALVVIADLLAESRRANLLAERRHEALRQLSRELVFDLHDHVAHLPGATRAREELIATGLAQLDALREEARERPELLAELVEAYARLAEVQGRPTAASRGDSAAAHATALEALALAERLHELAPRRPGVGELEARALDVAAVLELRMSRPTEALARLESALARVEPDSPVLPSLLHHRAQALAALGRTAEAMSQGAQACELARSRLAQTPGELGLTRTLQTALFLQSDLHAQALDLERAELEALEALELAEALYAARPGDVQLERDLALCLAALARVRLAAGRPAEAREAVVRQLELFERLAALDPDDAIARRDLSLAYERRGTLDWAEGRGEEALASFERAVELDRAALAHDPLGAEGERSLALSLEKLSDAALGLGRLDLAEECAGELVERLSARLDSDPADGFAARTLPIGVLRLAQVALQRGDHGPALEGFEESARDLAAVAERDPDDGWSARLAMVARYFVGWTHREIGHEGSRPAAERRAHLELACSELERSQEMFTRLRDRGLLLAGDEQQSQSVEREIEACRTLLLDL